MKIYFGRLPTKSFINLDGFFGALLKYFNYSYNDTVDELIKTYWDSNIVFHTINPMILQWLDKEYESCIYFIDKNDIEIQFIQDPTCQEKYKIMGIGEVLEDDHRVYG
jgi:hypothetical protein